MAAKLGLSQANLSELNCQLDEACKENQTLESQLEDYISKYSELESIVICMQSTKIGLDTAEPK
jgi:hypothetical protein